MPVSAFTFEPRIHRVIDRCLALTVTAATPKAPAAPAESPCWHNPTRPEAPASKLHRRTHLPEVNPYRLYAAWTCHDAAASDAGIILTDQPARAAGPQRCRAISL